jgi:phosphomannomutase
MFDIKAPIVLFDVDGTITESRRRIEKHVITALRELSLYSEIGFLSGSNLEFIKEQLWPLFADTRTNNFHILPCNGTEYWITNPDVPGDFIEISSTSMFNEVGYETYQNIVKLMIIMQAEIAKCEHYDIPYTGHHIQNRSSMFNWCPIGRNANHSERRQFITMDKMYRIRNKFLMEFKRSMFSMDIDNIEIKLAGDTSFDIFPKGWDKTYALKHFPKEEWEVYFVGDRCYPNGNDYEIYKDLEPEGRAFSTGSPEETVEIIDTHLLRLIPTE